MRLERILMEISLDKKENMSHDLDQILISHENFDGHELGKLQGNIIAEPIFGYDSKERNDVLKIINGIVINKDSALIEYTKRFDKVELTPDQIQINGKELKEAHSKLDKKLLGSIKQAIKNVEKYQQEIFVGKSIPGKVKYTPIERIGICVPGASAPLPSTVIMTAVPAQVAGVKEIAVVSPPRYNGSIHPVTLAVCHELELTEVYRIGGAQAVATLAYGIYGEAKIPIVDKIVGPGNKWVQTAKQIVSGMTVGIDSIAGPSEVLIIANDKANPAWVAADMLSQAEHAPGSAITLTDSMPFAQNVLKELTKQIEQLDRADSTIECLKKYGRIIELANMDDVVHWANKLATEHLEIQCGDESREIADKIKNAGAIFIGDYSPVAVGDYWAGPSHTLPTGRSARFASALSANDFVKATSIIEYSKDQLAESSDDIIRLAMTEGLDAHAKSVTIRQGK
ncbi:MAG: histidinol dehydrogenase [Planctomycetes bacterium]|nr:histidinol dehydrogenase [Planctomycetota bacterium]